MKIEESEKAGSCWESNPGHLACAVIALPPKLWQLDNHQPSQSSMCTAQVVMKCLSRTPGSILVCAISSDCRPFHTTDGTSLRKSLAALFVLTSRGCNRSVVPAGTMITTISFSNFSSSKVVVWPPKLSVRTKAFWDDAPISSLTFSIYQRSEDRFLR